ncbi:MAG: tetratricopeptide repeat protein [Actinomycetota bacterium]
MVESAVALLNEALGLFRKVGDRMSEASCLNSLGIVARNQNDLDRAEELLSQSASIRREIGDQAGTAGSLDNLGIVAVDRGDLDRAQRLFEESITIDRARGDEWGVACALGSLGVVHLERGKLEEAHTAVERALRTFDRIGDLDGAVETMEALAGVDAAAGRSLRAARLGGAIDAIRRRVGIPLSPVDRIHWERWLERPRRELGDDFEGAWAEGTEMTTEQAISYALGESTLK